MAEDGAEGSPLPTGFSSGLSRDDPLSKSATNSDNPREPPPVAAESREIFRALEVVERDSTAIAESFASLFSSLRLALSEVTSISVENMQCFRDVVGQLQESGCWKMWHQICLQMQPALDAATKGNRYINSCLRLNEEMKGMESLALQLKLLRRNVDALELAVNRLLPLP